jgi:hypothetical protein
MGNSKRLQESHMADIRSSIAHPKLVDLYDYWNRIRGLRDVPARADFDPIDIPKLLPYLILNEVERNPIRFRIRLEGTAVAAVRRRPGTGRYLDEPGIVVLHNGVIEAFTRMIADRQPWYSEGSFRLEDGRSGHLHRLALPLSRDGVSVDMILVGFIHELTAS